MKKATQSLELFWAEHADARTMRIALVLLTLVTLVISAGAPVGGGGPQGR